MRKNIEVKTANGTVMIQINENGVLGDVRVAFKGDNYDDAPERLLLDIGPAEAEEGTEVTFYPYTNSGDDLDEICFTMKSEY